MFEAVCFRDGATPQGGVDLALLAEALVFYGKVHFISNHSAYEALLSKIGPFETLELLKGGYPQIHVSPDQTMVLTTDGGTSRERFDFGFVKKSNTEPLADARKLFLKYAGSAAVAESAEFAKTLHFTREGKINLPQIRSEIRDSASFRSTVGRWLRAVAPEAIPDSIYLDTWELAGHIQVATNLDFARISSALAATRGQPEYKLGMADLLVQFASSHEDVFYAAQLSAEVSASYLTAPFLQARFYDLWDRSQSSKAQIFHFSDVVLESGRAIGAAIVEGRASFSDLINVLNDRRRFREWIENRPFDSDLVKEYFAAVSGGMWIDKLPSRATRWAIVGAAGIAAEAVLPSGIAIATSLGLSAFDGFLLEKMAKGWRPDQFINSSLRPLISNE